MIEKKSELTSPVPEKKMVSEVLRHIDVLIRGNDLAKAFLEIQHAKKIDNKNPYVIAYEERLSALIEEKKIKDREKEKKREEENALNEKKLRENTPLRASQNIVDKLKSVEQLPIARSGSVSEKPPTIPPIKQEVHSTHSLLKNSNKAATAVIHQKVMVIDDDKSLLLAISETVSMHGYDCISFDTTDAAFEYLQKGNEPDIIVCDINLETSTMGGFGFFEKLRNIGGLSAIPFIFLSGLSDEAVIRTGKELGADDYLTKPISEEMLMSTIKGKLKRFQHLKKRN